jgi:hypothetical protein
LPDDCENEDDEHMMEPGTDDSASDAGNGSELAEENGEPMAEDADGEYNPAQQPINRRSQPRAGRM